MRKVTLNMNEENKFNIIRNLIKKSGNKHHPSVKLNCSIRTIDRLIKKYLNYNKEKDSSEEKDTFTQFSYACKQLGIGIK